MLAQRCESKNRNLKRIACFFIAIVAVSAGAAATGKSENEARKSAEQWLSLVDAGEFAQSWDTAGAYLQHACTKDVWLRKLDSMRKPLGELRSRKIKSSLFQKHDQYFLADRVRLEFSSSFTNKPTAVETATIGLEKDGTWRVVGYYIK